VNPHPSSAKTTGNIRARLLPSPDDIGRETPETPAAKTMNLYLCAMASPIDQRAGFCQRRRSVRSRPKENAASVRSPKPWRVADFLRRDPLQSVSARETTAEMPPITQAAKQL